MKEEKDNIKEAKQEAEAMEATRETEQANETPKPETEETCTNTAEGVEEEEASNETSGEKDELTAAQEEIAQLKDKYLRSVAEFDNYRKRTLKEKAELILNGSEKAVQAILPIIDDMERAIANAEKTDDVNVLREGMQLIYQKTNKIMESLGVKRLKQIMPTSILIFTKP